MRKNVIRLTLCAMLFALSYSASAQQPGKVPRVGYLIQSGDPNTPPPSVEAFRQGLRDLGYVEGKNILIELRSAEGKNERFPSLAAKLVQLKVDVLVIGALTAIRAAKQATKTIPIVMVTTADPVAAGLIDSLARPGGNVTGLTLLIRDLSGKRLELLKEVGPTTSRVGFLLEADSPTQSYSFQGVRGCGPASKDSTSIRGGTNSEPRFRGSISHCGQGAHKRANYG